MYSPSGELLCHTDRKKVEWYLKKNLATKIGDDPIQIVLNFVPNKRGHEEKKNIDNYFYTVDRKNNCVVCGYDKHFSKYHIVPSLYRSYFPNSYKSHRAHDVVLLCLACREKANKIADEYKVELSKKYDVPLIVYHKTKQI